MKPFCGCCRPTDFVSICYLAVAVDEHNSAILDAGEASSVLLEPHFVGREDEPPLPSEHRFYGIARIRTLKIGWLCIVEREPASE